MDYYFIHNVVALTRYHFVIFCFQPIVHGNPCLYIVWQRVELEILNRSSLHLSECKQWDTSTRCFDGVPFVTVTSSTPSVAEVAILQDAE